MSQPGHNGESCSEPKDSKGICFQGSHTVGIEAGTLWQALNDPDILQHCIHGCSSVEKLHGNEYLATFGVRIGPVKKDFVGHLSIVDAQPPSSYQLRSTLDAGRAGVLEGAADVKLTPLSRSHTRLEYSARVSATGLLSRFGRRLLGGAAHKYMDSFFARLVQKVQEGV